MGNKTDAQDPVPLQDEATGLALRRFSLDYLIVIVGFGLCRAWIVFSLSASVACFETRTDWVFLVAGAVAAALMALVMTRFMGSMPRMHERLTDIMLGLVVASAVCVPAASSLDSPSLLLLGLITGGAAAGMLQVMWGERFAAQDRYFSLACAPAAAIVTGLVLAMSSDGNQLIFIALPALSVALLALECRRCSIVWKTGLPEGQMEDEDAGAEAAGGAAAPLPAAPRERMRLDRSSTKLMVSIMVFSFLVRMFDAFPIVGADPFHLFGGSGSFSLVLVGAIFLVIAFLTKNHLNVSLLYRLSLPVMIAGLIAIALVFGQRAPLAVLLIAIGYELFDILSWVLFSEIAHRNGQGSAPYVFGMGVAYTFVGMAAGYVASAVMSPLVQEGSLQLSAVSLVAILCLVVIAFMVLPESVVSSIPLIKGSNRKPEKPAAAPSEPGLTLEQKCSGVAEACGLTPREREVLEFLARGRTLSIVARDLHIAKNTARTHIEKIYQKTGIHKQQDLIDFVEEWKGKA